MPHKNKALAGLMFQRAMEQEAARRGCVFGGGKIERRKNRKNRKIEKNRKHRDTDTDTNTDTQKITKKTC